NIVTAAVCGLFGLPGLVLLILLKILFGNGA
ncbi:MAG: pro-sigmaK processing inhibitor BofA family protein, partial [Clostridia bacterium]|nr:pro-sigmaK processing inhibitor BofA family protein [Clostridia bacterium]